MADHVVDMLPRCQHILNMAHTDIDRGFVLEDSNVRDILEPSWIRHERHYIIASSVRTRRTRVSHTQ